MLADEGKLEKPDREMYTSLLLAHTRSKSEDALIKAEGVLSKMEELYNQGHSEIKPDTHTYNVLLCAYAYSQDPDKLSKAVSTFERLQARFNAGEKDCEPDVSSYNWVSKPKRVSKLIWLGVEKVV